MAKNERNMLSLGAEALIKRSTPEVQLVSKAGRPSAADSHEKWERHRNYTTSLVMDKEQHNQIKRLANKTGITFKQVMYLLLEEGLNRYDSGELVIAGPRDDEN